MVTLTDIERESYKNSPVHRLDPRVKILFTLVIIIYVVSLPRIHEKNMLRLFAVEVYLFLLVLVAGLDLRYFILRTLRNFTIWACNCSNSTFFKACFY